MDDRNGECFDRQDELFNQLNASDSEHECLREFLLDSEVMSKTVPSSKVVSGDINNCLNKMPGSNIELITQSFANKNNVFDSNILESIRRTEGTEFPINCEELNIQPSVSSAVSLDSARSEGKPTNGDVFPKSNDHSSVEMSRRNSEPLDSILNVVQKVSAASPKSETNSLANLASDASPSSASPSTASDSGSAPIADLGNGYVTPGKTSAARGRKRKVPGAGLAKAPARPKVPGAGRGRPPGTTKKTPSVTYQSQISPNQNGIKIFIKKSSMAAPVVRTPKPKGSVRKRKTKKGTDAEGSGEEAMAKRVRWKGVGEAEGMDEDVPVEQSDWGLRLPTTVLHQVFMLLTHDEGCIPFLPRMSRVCRLWHGVASSPSLWHNIDLSGRSFKEKFKNNVKFHWLCENRLTRVQDLNLGGWKFPVIQATLETISETCLELRGLNMSGWKGLTAEHLKHLTTNCKLLARVDLSSICPESNNTKGALSLLSITSLVQTTGDRLTHLILADNKLSGFPQIIQAIATHCPNLQVLDFSNLKTGSRTTAPFHIERLQEGCPKLRVLRITNSEVALSATPLMEQAASPGFPMLEELSVAGIGIDGLCSTPIIDDNSIERILKSSNKLRLLDVRGCTRITDSSLVRVPAWDLEHLFLSGCYVTRLLGSGLELIAQKWCHSLVEMDLAWSTASESVDSAVAALAECESESPLRVLNLCGSSISLEPVKKVLRKCPHLISLNLASCRALPRGIKRLYEQHEVDELRGSFEDPPRIPESKKTQKAKAQAESTAPQEGTSEVAASLVGESASKE